MSHIRTTVVFLFLCGVFSLSAQSVNPTDTVPSDTARGGRVIIHADTFKVQGADVTEWSDDEMLLQMLTIQRQRQLRTDSLIQDSLAKREIFLHDSLVADLRYRDSLLSVQQRMIRDSLDRLLADERAHKAYEDSLAHEEFLRDSVAKALAAGNTAPQIELTPSLVKDPEEDARERKRLLKYIYSPWRMDATVQVQFAQNYITKNWYQGGNRLNYNLLSLIKGNAVYSRNNILWENYGEWRAGIANAPGDTIRKYTVTDDVFRIYSKFGYQVVKKLYISGSVEFKTNLWNVWKANENIRKSALLTPIRFSIDVGIDYKPVNGLSIVVSPASYKMVYALYVPTESDRNKIVDATAFGMEKRTDHLLNQIGSSMRVKWQYKPIREIELNTEFYIYTNYKKVEIDWQTDCNFIFNRFLSARISLHPRYDNTVKDENGKAKIQFKEILSIGFAHRFK